MIADVKGRRPKLRQATYEPQILSDASCIAQSLRMYSFRRHCGDVLRQY